MEETTKPKIFIDGLEYAGIETVPDQYRAEVQRQLVAVEKAARRAVTARPEIEKTLRKVIRISTTKKDEAPDSKPTAGPVGLKPAKAPVNDAEPPYVVIMVLVVSAVAAAFYLLTR